MPNETLDLPAETKENISPEEIEEIGEVALEGIPVAIDSDPARLIHEEFPSVSPRPAESIGQIRHEITPGAETTPSQEQAVEQLQTPEAHSLTDFEELLGQPLPEEIKQELSKLKSEKLSGVQAELDMLDKFREQLEAEPCSSWIREGYLQPPSIAEAASQQFKDILEQKLATYLSSKAGQKDLEEGNLKDFVENPHPTDEDLAKAAAILGIPFSKTKLRLLPKQRDKLTATLTEGAKLRLVGEPGYDYLSDEKVVMTPEQKSAKEKYAVESELDSLISPSTRIFRDELDASRLFKPDTDRPLTELPDEIIKLEKSKDAAVSTLLQAEADSPLSETLSAIARGNLTLEEAAAILVEKEGSTRKYNLGVNRFQEAEAAKLTRLLAEPSLLGLDLDETDLSLIGNGFDKLVEISTLLGRQPVNKSMLMDRVREDVTEQQQAFFEKMGSAYDMYWHFSPFGLQIIREKQLSPSAVTGNRLTAEHSKSLHFIKPGFFGQEAAIDYTGYAQTELRLGSSGDKKHIAEPFGIAIIYPLGEIASELPYRDEPALKDRTSEDVVFREAETGEPQESLPLEKAFILPMQTMEQLGQLRSNPDYQDIFTEEWQSREELAVKATRRALQLSGYSEDWIDKHVLPPVDSSDGRSDAAEVYTKTSEEIRARLPENHEIIMTLTAKRGDFEFHDVHAAVKKGWRERLVRVETQKSAAA